LRQNAQSILFIRLNVMQIRATLKGRMTSKNVSLDLKSFLYLRGAKRNTQENGD
jgi:hypothetical protein